MKPKMVLVPTLESEKRPKTSFKQLSQSGGVVNAYNAMELAKNKYAR
jgi:hypothetical protein